MHTQYIHIPQEIGQAEFWNLV